MRLMLIMAALTCLAGCWLIPEDQTCPQRDSVVTQAAFAKSDSFWTTEQVPVCWMTSDFAYERAFVEYAVLREWDQYIDLDFVGWGICDDTMGGVRIKIVDDRPQSKIGQQHTAVATMRLNFEFNEFMTSCAKQEDSRMDCIYVTSLHEFGHALGLVHEQNRSDVPDTCEYTQTGTMGDKTYGEYDEDSIMEACSIPDRPSCGDINAVQQIYGVENDEIE